MEDDHPGLWQRWFESQCVAVGWSSPPQRWKDARFKVLQADNDVVRIQSEKFFHQKLDYIHANPVRHGVVERAIDYPYSSLRWYSD
jgi:hypothetical protein